MKRMTIMLLLIAAAGLASAQEQSSSHSIGGGATTLGETANLPVEKIGNNDLVGITVYDAPELTRTLRVGTDGDIRMPMLRQHIHASGLYPSELETAISTALVEGSVLVDPIVTVSVVEYRSRPISVVGAVKNPMTFQATGIVTLLDAISQAQGLTENAGAEILVTRQPAEGDAGAASLVKRIPVHALISGEDPALNIRLEGGEEIRVPEAGRVFVVGDVKKPGAFYITDSGESSVMKALSLSEGLDQYPAHTAYIYRLEGATGARKEVPIDIKKIMDRKQPDIPLVADDILYIPDAAGMRAGLKILQQSISTATVLGSSLIYVYH